MPTPPAAPAEPPLAGLSPSLPHPCPHRHPPTPPARPPLATFLQESDLAVLKDFPPRTLPALAAQRDVLLSYAAASPATVAVGYCGAYLLMQTFAIPGTIMLSLLAGGLYGVWRGCLLVAAVSTAGSCSCYCMSWVLGQPLARTLGPQRLEKYAGEVRRRRGELLNYIIFLRVTPILPNTFVNVASPIVGVPLLPFALGESVGATGLAASHSSRAIAPPSAKCLGP